MFPMIFEFNMTYPVYAVDRNPKYSTKKHINMTRTSVLASGQIAYKKS